MHDLEFRHQNDLTEAGLDRLASELGLSPDQFAACMKGSAAQKVKADQAEASALGIVSTPFFLIGTVENDGRVKFLSVLKGVRSIEEFKTAIEKAEKAVGTPKP